MQRKRKILVPIIIVCVCLLIEAFFSAFPFFAFVAGRKGDNHVFLTDSSAVIMDNSSEVSFRFDATELNSVSFKVTPDTQFGDGYYSELSVYASSEDSPEAYRLAAKKKIGIDSNPAEKKIYLSPDYDVAGILLQFSDTGKVFEVSDVSVNPQFVFEMNYLRFAVIFAAVFLAYFVKEYREFFGSFDFKNVTVLTVVLCALGSVMFSGICFTSDGAETLVYEKGMDVSGMNPYVQQFDAFEKGQLNIDVEPDEALLEMKNPYDPYERGEAEILWDRAYKDGKYYSYFGTAPVFTVYYPFYLLTGKLPAESFVMAIFAFIVSVFLPLAVMFLSKLINCNISPWFASMTAFGALGASMVYILQRGYAPFYYIASISAMAFGAATIFWGILAYISKKKASKILAFVASGISFAFCIHSRLNIAFSIGTVIAAALIVYFIRAVKLNDIKASMINIVSFCAPVGAGVILAMWYNYARFSNPFDFGSAYQLTVADTSTYSLSGSGFFPMIYQYFLRGFELIPEFPFIKIPLDNITDIGKYVYTDSNIGIFAMPFMIAILFSFFVFRSRSVSKQRKVIFAAMIASMLLTAFADICLGGIIFRYTADISLIGAIASAAVILQLFSICLLENKAETGKIIKGSSAALCGANAFVTMASMLMFNANLVNYYPSIFEYFRSFVVFWK